MRTLPRMLLDLADSGGARVTLWNVQDAVTPDDAWEVTVHHDDGRWWAGSGPTPQAATAEVWRQMMGVPGRVAS